MVAANGFSKRVIRVILLHAVAIGVASIAAAQTPEARRSGGPQEGIKVHGHWVVEISNPDGTLADRREFENAHSPIVVSSRMRSRAATRISRRCWRA